MKEILKNKLLKKIFLFQKYLLPLHHYSARIK